MTRSRTPSSTLRFPAFAGPLVLLLIGIFAAVYEESQYQTQRARSRHEHAEILAASVTAALSFNDRATTNEYVASMRVNPELEAVGVYDLDGALVAGFARPHTAKLAERMPDPGSAGSDAEIIPVVERNTKLGSVYVRAAPEAPLALLARYSVLALLAVMAAIVVAGLTSAQGKLRKQAGDLESANASLRREMAERAKAEEALRQSQKMEAVGQLSGGIAHDLNNHLTIIKGNLRLLQQKQRLAADDRHFVNAMEGVNRAASLTQRVLSFSRKQSLSPTTLDLNVLLDELDPLIRNSLHENTTLIRDCRSRGLIVIDRNQMENVVLNLVLNARDAMPQGGALHLTTEDVVGGDNLDQNRGYVRLQIRDTGSGMSDDIRSKALDPFFTTKPVGQGTGLGLSTAYGFVTQSGGHLLLDSAPNNGTTVEIYLPHAPQPALRCEGD
jgi:signal transduction histidine kinase